MYMEERSIKTIRTEDHSIHSQVIETLAMKRANRATLGTVFATPYRH